MKNLLILTLFVALISCNNSSNSTTHNVSLIADDDKEVLTNFKTVLWPKAYGDQDTILLDRLLHDDFQLIDDNGDKYSKADELAYIAKYGPSYDEFAFEISRLDLFENGTAVVSGTGIMKGVSGAEAYITKYQSSNVMIKVSGEWKMINSHVSGVKEETFPIVGEELEE